MELDTLSKQGAISRNVQRDDFEDDLGDGRETGTFLKETVRGFPGRDLSGLSRISYPQIAQRRGFLKIECIIYRTEDADDPTRLNMPISADEMPCIMEETS